jgi:hypothetical protein
LTIRNSELTIIGLLHTSRSASVLCNTACVVVGKNYRLQNIQLSKIKLGGFAPKPPARRSRGPSPRSAPHQEFVSRNTEVAKTDYVGSFSRCATCAALTAGADVGARGDSSASPTRR